MGKRTVKKSRNKGVFQDKRAIRCNFESLELRQMLATVSVTNYGATPNDGTDDRAAIQRAINASASGDTILFSGGTFNMSDELTLPGSRTYLGQNGATLKGEGREGHLLKVQSDNVTVRGLTINGGGIFLEKSGGRNTNITIDSNRFQMTTGGLHKSAITFTTGLNNSSITNNHLTGYNGGFAMYGYNYYGLTIANNEIINMSAGMHIDAFGGSGNLLVEQNYISGTKGMGMEFQSTASNLVFQDNWYENPSFVSLSGSSGGNTMAYSLILDKSSNVTIRRNVAIQPIKGTTGSDYVRIMFEVGGDNTLVEDNYTYGGNHVVAMNDGVGTASVTVRNNKFLNYAQGVSNSFPSSTRTLTHSNNGNIRLSDTMESRLAAGQRPGIGSKRYGSATQPPVSNPLPNPSTPAPTPIPTETGVIYLSDINATDVINGWGPMELDQSVGEREVNDGGKLTIGSRSYTKGLGVHATSRVTYALNGQFTAFNSDIGVDEESGNNGSVVFEVWADGELLYTSGIVRGTDGHKSVSVDVGGKKELTLVVTNAGDNSHFDHADWANARLTPGIVSNPGTVEPGRTPTQTGGVVTSYLSDMNWLSATNGWGPVELNTSNGEMKLSDGNTITMDGKTYNRGLGVHANSTIKYALGGKYQTFSADIGLDDETLGRGSVVFEVWADGQMLYSSGVVTADDGARSIEVDVSGRQELSLIVKNGGDNINFDHANWADARLSTSGTNISSLPFTVVENGYGPVERDMSLGDLAAGDGQLITLNGVVYGTGLGVHAPSDIVINLDGKYARFVSDIGVDDEMFANGTVIFQVWIDGQLAYDSGLMTNSSTTKTVNLDVTGKQQLSLKVLTGGDGFGFDHADWAGAKLVAVG